MRIAIIGCGSIGTTLARAAENIDEIKKVYLFDRSGVCSDLVEKLKKATAVSGLEEIIDDVDIVVESASQDAAKLYSPIALRHGKDIMIMSVGSLADKEFREEIERLAKEHRCFIYVPSGALSGIDGVKSAFESGINEVTLVSRKNPLSFKENEFVKSRGIDIENIKEPVVVFEGTAEEAVRYFPRNINVAATLSLAGIGFEKTKVKIIADPSIHKNTHTIIIKGDFGEMRSEIDNVPFPENPKTSYLAALSAIATLRKIVSVFRIGT